MTDYRPLALAVEARLAVVSDHELRNRDPQAHLDKLRTTTEALNAIVAKLPPETDPQLSHFLQRQSYAKAADWLRDHAQKVQKVDRDVPAR